MFYDRYLLRGMATDDRYLLRGIFLFGRSGVVPVRSFFFQMAITFRGVGLRSGLCFVWSSLYWKALDCAGVQKTR